MTLDEAAAFFAKAATRTELLLEATLLEFGEVVKKAAQGMIGHDNPMWPPLSVATVEDKAQKGFDSPAPLLRTGAMRESIVAEVGPVLTLAVGSDDQVAVYQEMGTSRMPPRPFLSTAMIDNLPFVDERLTADAAELLTGARP